MMLRARDELARRGGPAVFVARFIVIVRAVMPALAGLSDLRLRTFVLYAVLGGAVWATLYTMLGYALGAAYQHALHEIGIWTYVAFGALAVAFAAWQLMRTRRHRRMAAEQTDDPKA
jgi:membrane-associated protein